MYEIVLFGGEEYLYKPAENKWISLTEPNYELDAYNEWVAEGNVAPIVPYPPVSTKA